jgi:hypothetical protein
MGRYGIWESSRFIYHREEDADEPGGEPFSGCKKETRLRRPVNPVAMGITITGRRESPTSSEAVQLSSSTVASSNKY